MIHPLTETQWSNTRELFNDYESEWNLYLEKYNIKYCGWDYSYGYFEGNQKDINWFLLHI